MDRSPHVKRKSGLEGLRVLLVVNSAVITAKRFVVPLAERLHALGCEVIIALGPGEHLSEFQGGPWRVEMLPVARKALSLEHPKVILALYRLMRRERIQVVHTQTILVSALTRIAARLARVPVVIYHVRGTYAEGNRLKGFFEVAYERLMGPLNTLVLTLNEGDRKEFVEAGIAAPDRVLCMGVGGSGIDLNAFDLARIPPEQSAALRAEFDIRPGERVLTFIGRMVKAKGILDLLEAFRIVAAAFPQVRLLMIGDNLKGERDQTTFAEFKRRAAAYGLAGQITCPGFRKDVAEIMSVTDLLVHPSYREGFGMTIAEAAAMGRPSVVSDTRGGQQAVIDGVTGFVVTKGAPDQLAEAILRILRDPERLAEMGRNARRRAEEVFSEESLLDRMVDVYRKLVRNHVDALHNGSKKDSPRVFERHL